MFTTAILTIACCQVPYGPQSQWGWDGTVQNRSGWGYARLYGHGYYPPEVLVPRAMFVPIPNNWQAVVDDLRARRPSSRDRAPPPEVVQYLQELDLHRAQLYDQLTAAPRDRKQELRAAWLQARRDLERARIQAVRMIP
jgi:hypothetical protein